MSDQVEQYREDWLHDVGQHLLETVFSEHDIPAPPGWRVSCGWPHGSRGKVIGQCFKREAAEDEVNHLFVSPTIDNTEQVVAVLAHELLHACDDCQSGHRGTFAKWAKAVGFERPFTQCLPGDALRETIREIALIFGNYPHRKLDTSQRKKQTTRNIKWFCTDCGFKANGSRSQLQAVADGACVCPACGSHDSLSVSVGGIDTPLAGADIESLTV